MAPARQCAGGFLFSYLFLNTYEISVYFIDIKNFLVDDRR